MRILAIDLGEKRIGLALSDDSGILASPLEVITYSRITDVIERIKRIARNKRVQKVIVGLPLDMKGIQGIQAENARDFAQQLQGAIDIAVELWDERLTSVQAERALLEANISRAGRKERTDMVAAALLLQSYLDTNRNKEVSSH